MGEQVRREYRSITHDLIQVELVEDYKVSEVLIRGPQGARGS